MQAKELRTIHNKVNLKNSDCNKYFSNLSHWQKIVIDIKVRFYWNLIKYDTVSPQWMRLKSIKSYHFFINIFFCWHAFHLVPAFTYFALWIESTKKKPLKFDYYQFECSDVASYNIVLFGPLERLVSIRLLSRCSVLNV